MGPGMARNIGWNNATGNYIAFLDSDDSWNPLKLEIQINSMIKYKAWFSFHDLAIYEQKSVNKNSELIITSYKLRDNLLKNNISTPTVVVSCEIKERFPNQKYSEDYSLWLQILNQKYKSIYIKKTMAYHYLDSGLSSNFLMMEFGEIQSYLNLAKKTPLLIPLVLFAIFYSLLKFLKRLITRFYLKILRFN
jgi:glycosyltransferase involved in cell wall biosynthesis